MVDVDVCKLLLLNPLLVLYDLVFKLISDVNWGGTLNDKGGDNFVEKLVKPVNPPNGLDEMVVDEVDCESGFVVNFWEVAFELVKPAKPLNGFDEFWAIELSIDAAPVCAFFVESPVLRIKNKYFRNIKTLF